MEKIKADLAPGRTESHAFLLWFLKNYYRLDEIDAADAVCDGPDDKGIDGIYVDHNLETVDVFQCKLVQNATKSLGDTQLKEFVGTLAQLGDRERIEEIAATTSNTELANLLKSENVATRVADGFTVRGVFLTNIIGDKNAREGYKLRRLRMSGRITLRVVEALEPGMLAWDSDVRGFGVRCQREAKVYVLKARVGGKQRWFTIGRHGAPWTPETARREARRKLGEIAGGSDPSAARSAEKANPTLAALVRMFLEEHAEAKRKPRAAAEYRRMLALLVLPRLGERRTMAITQADVAALHHGLRATP